MAIKVKTSTEGAGSGPTWLKEPGRFHAMLLHADEAPLDKNNQPLDAFKLQFLICAGEHKGKQCDLTFFFPDASKSEKSIAFAERKQTACLVALGLISDQQMGGEVTVDLLAALNPPRQFFVELERQEGKEFLSLAFANIYHIDDPACADATMWPRDAAMIAKIPPACRRDPKGFPKHERKAPAHAPAQQSEAPKNLNFDGF